MYLLCCLSFIYISIHTEKTPEAAIRLARAPASHKRDEVAISDLEVAMTASNNFEFDLKGPGLVGHQ